jgi:hypothetical protein
MPDNNETKNTEQEGSNKMPSAGNKQDSTAAANVSVIDGGTTAGKKANRPGRKTSHLRVVK